MWFYYPITWTFVNGNSLTTNCIDLVFKFNSNIIIWFLPLPYHHLQHPHPHPPPTCGTGLSSRTVPDKQYVLSLSCLIMNDPSSLPGRLNLTSASFMERLPKNQLWILSIFIADWLIDWLIGDTTIIGRSCYAPCKYTIPSVYMMTSLVDCLP